MEDRLVQLLKSEGINPTRFAERIGVQRSSMSHILSGRNKPSFDFIIKILESFPSLNPDWLLRGKGMMYKNDVPVQPSLFDTVNYEKNRSGENLSETKTAVSGIPADVPDLNYRSPVMPDACTQVNGNSFKKIDKIVIFYTDKTFKDYLPHSE
jgi:transcriptional regulator with XRE-family HTH domain